MPAKPRVALLFGGRSSEHEISCATAGSVLAAIDRDRYDVLPIGITRGGRWVQVADDPSALRIVDGVLPEVRDEGPSVLLPADPCQRRLIGEERAPELPAIDVVFPLLHGPYGEDGTVQGLLDLAGLPYVGSGVLASAASMDKDVMKRLLAASGLPVGDHEVLTPEQLARDGGAALRRVERLGLPVFVKPARGGSSIGISKVSRAADLRAAVVEAQRWDRKVVVEAEVAGREVECGVLGSLGGEPAQASLPAEIRVLGDHEFYDFEAKYLDAATALDVPADLDPDTTAQIRGLAVAAYEALGCEGLARVDFFLCPDGRVVVNELNTMPGFTETSMFPRMWAATGVDYPALVDRLLQLALERGASQA